MISSGPPRRLRRGGAAAEAQGVRWKPDLFILHNRTGGGTAPSAKFPAPGAARCLGSRRQRPARDTVRAAAEFRATGIWAPRGRRGPALRGVYFSWPPAAGAPGGAPGGHPNRGAPLAARAVPHGDWASGTQTVARAGRGLTFRRAGPPSPRIDGRAAPGMARAGRARFHLTRACC